jgi:sigma-E factor negative regulatory protein RseA
MTDNIRESLSALMDDEATDFELERVLKQSVADDEVRDIWSRYNLARHSSHAVAVEHLNWDISKQVRAALADEVVDAHGARPGHVKRVLRPLASFAVAASVAATVVLGGQQLAQVGGADPYDQGSALVNISPPVGIRNIAGATPVPASYGNQEVRVLRPMTPTAYRDLAQQRLSKYSQEHAEQAALNSPQGLISYARVPMIRE